MTVPPLFGWGEIVTILVLLVAVAVVFFVIASAGAPVSGRSEWQASLDARSSRRRTPVPDADDASDEPRSRRRAPDDPLIPHALDGDGAHAGAATVDG